MNDSMLESSLISSRTPSALLILSLCSPSFCNPFMISVTRSRTPFGSVSSSLISWSARIASASRFIFVLPVVGACSFVRGVFFRVRSLW